MRSPVLRKPLERDIGPMYRTLEDALRPFLFVNEGGSEHSRLILDRRVVEEYLYDDRYFAVLAEIDGRLAGWLAGGAERSILSEHGWKSEGFYLEEIVVDKAFRRRGIGKRLIESLNENESGIIIADAIIANTEAVRFYEGLGFNRWPVSIAEFSRNWIRFVKNAGSKVP